MQEHVDPHMLLAAENAGGAQEDQRDHQCAGNFLGPVQRIVQRVAVDDGNEDYRYVDCKNQPP